jgi:DNA-binding IscR family transcriptional regulator
MGATTARVYDAMVELEDANDGWPVPIESVTQAVGLASKSTTLNHLQALVRAGVVEKSPFAKGGYRVKREKG